MGTDIGDKLDQILEKLNSLELLNFTKSLKISKNGNCDDVIQSTFECPNGYQIQKVIYTTAGFSTDAFYKITMSNIDVLDDQNRTNVTNKNLDISSIQDKSNITLYIRRYGESGNGTISLSCNITISKI